MIIDDETSMKELEESVRSIEKDGLVWGGSKLVAVGFGIKKLQINLVIEDNKISVDDLQQQIEEFEDYVQSTDVVSTNAVPKTFNLTNLNRLPCKSCRLFVYSLPFSHLPVSILHKGRSTLGSGLRLNDGCGHGSRMWQLMSGCCMTMKDNKETTG